AKVHQQRAGRRLPDRCWKEMGGEPRLRSRRKTACNDYTTARRALFVTNVTDTEAPCGARLRSASRLAPGCVYPKETWPRLGRAFFVVKCVTATAAARPHEKKSPAEAGPSPYQWIARQGTNLDAPSSA